MNNRLGNVHNRFQNYKKFPRVLCVCSAGLLRSPTTAYVLSQEPFNKNTRAAGLEREYALVPVDQALLEWADEVVCMNDEQALHLKVRLAAWAKESGTKPVEVINLNIPDEFEYRNAILCAMIADRYTQHKAQ